MLEYMSPLMKMNWTELTDEKVLTSLVENGERSDVEFKAHMPSLSVLAKHIAALANTGGGVVLIGVTDTGEVVGIPADSDIARKAAAATQLFSHENTLSYGTAIIPFRDRLIGIIAVGINGLLPSKPIEIDGTMPKRIGTVVAAMLPSEYSSSIAAALDPHVVEVSDTDLRRFLAVADEDALTEKLVVPLLRYLGFESVFAKGHRDKTLEFGQDLRGFKFRLPTGDWLYFAAQLKVGEINSSAREPDKNIERLFQQVQMAFGWEVFDPHTNSYHAVNHVLIIASGTISASAQEYFHRRLSDLNQPRRVIWIDGHRLLDLAQRVGLPGAVQIDIRAYLKAMDQSSLMPE